ncbi:MAG TPA: hypothetical protein VLE02_06655 [Nitrosarchaeum sp.]|nr:hypothetical protein [Nitrosarchaeum sp.]
MVRQKWKAYPLGMWTKTIERKGDFIMLINRQKSKFQQVFGLVTGLSFIIGLLGLGIILALGFSNTQLYWSSLWIMISLLVVGIIGVRVYGIVWSKK